MDRILLKHTVNMLVELGVQGKNVGRLASLVIGPSGRPYPYGGGFLGLSGSGFRARCMVRRVWA